jgi:hydroxymethylbilane synthase
MRLRAATRGSALALWQTRHVGALLATWVPGFELEPVVVETTADRRQDLAIESMGGKGVFVKEVQAAVLDGRADIAVHSAKDLPSATPEGLVLAAIPERADPRDTLVGARLDELPEGALVATGSARRRVQLAHLRPDLRFTGLRGNVNTRLAKRSEFDAIVMAQAAIDRLALAAGVCEVLEVGVLVPQVGQGALAVECRAGDESTRSLLASIQHAATRRTVDAERAFLAELGGDCALPAGAHAVLVGDRLHLTGVLASRDEHRLARHESVGDDPVVLGQSVARALLAQLAQHGDGVERR